MTSPVVFVLWVMCEYGVSVGDKFLEVELLGQRIHAPVILIDPADPGAWCQFTGASFLSAPLPLGLGLIQRIY